jgi:regulator of sirC expression with transglutaminase-like and TPR domain
MTPASKLVIEKARREFVALVNRGIEAHDLGRAALLIAEEDDPPGEAWDGRERVTHYLGVLDAMGAEARGRIAEVRDDDGRARVEAFNDLMFTTHNFTGNVENYYDPRNSLLTHVIERRIGIPITLSVVYIEVGRRAGFTVEGIGMPGHFIVRVHDTDDVSSDGILVDPFNRKIIDREECQERLDAIYGGQVALSGEHLQEVTSRQIIFRMLQNLKGIYLAAGLDREAIAIVERLLLLAPADLSEQRDYGMLLARAGRHAEAARELNRYLTLAPSDDDANATIREALKSVQAQAARLN